MFPLFQGPFKKGEAMTDKNGYPTEDELKFIIRWDTFKEGYQGLLEFIRDIWWSGDFGGFVWRGKWLHLHTWGWSGNEDIIEALKGNPFWFMFWYLSKRGGHYCFELHPEFKNKESIEKSLKKEKTNCTAVQCTSKVVKNDA